MAFDFLALHAQAQRYDDFLAQHATDVNRQRWQAVYDRVRLTNEQRTLLGSFTRKMPVLCLSGTWCGDCVNGCPIFQRIAEACPAMDLRFVNRPQSFDPHATDAATRFAVEVSICGGPRVPMLVMLSEDGYECARIGERTLNTYRNKVRQMHGASCPAGLLPPAADQLATDVAEWLTHFERVQWMLQTSPRLMKLHGEI